MAQIQETKPSAVERLKLMVRQRPLLGMAVALIAGLLAGAMGLGIAQAAGQGEQSGDFQIERGDGGTQDASADDDELVDDAGTSTGERGSASKGSSKGSSEVAAKIIVVDVSGAVNTPAVVELPSDARVRDAIEAAGGLAKDADVSGVNRAAKLTDGQQVYIPRVGEEAPRVSAGAPEGSASGDGSGQGAGSSLVNINTAGVEQLDQLPGVGPATAQAIVEDREANGSFASTEDLMRVSGIGEKKFEKLKGSICV
ncbi:MAG: ComEA family DNA-binding protein [Coriobacteriaceae bacterium]|nr:ComEA family DNA-binding protein [Coriobacteriaceae bacterium]